MKNYELLTVNELDLDKTYYLNHIGRWYQVVGGTKLANPTAVGMPFNLLDYVEYAFHSEEAYLEQMGIANEKEAAEKEKLAKLEGDVATNNFALPNEGLAALKKKP